MLDRLRNYGFVAGPQCNLVVAPPLKKEKFERSDVPKGDIVKYHALVLGQTVVGANGAVLRRDLWFKFFVYQESACLFGVLVFALDLSGAPAGGGRSGRKTGGNSSPNGRAEGIRVKSGKAAAYLPSLGFNVLTSPHDVVEVAAWSPTVVAGSSHFVVQLGK